MIQGQMQNTPLNILSILNFAQNAHSDQVLVSKLIDEPQWRYTYAQAHARTAQVANMLAKLGVRSGGFVSSLAWNTHRHYELFFAVPGMGAVLHTANPRLPDEHIIYTLNHADSTVLLYDRNLGHVLDRIRDKLTNIKHFIALTDEARTPADALSYEVLLSKETAAFNWPTIDENAGAFLCYTSGTTGDPKGVLYSHRSVVLHAFAASLTGALGFSAFDVIMPCQSLYHATAWGLPFAGTMNGSKFVFPADDFSGKALDELITAEKVTFSGGVPTIWTMYLDYLDQTGGDTGSLDRVIIGGSAVPRDMAVTFQTQYGVKVSQIWGMTETCPLGVVATPTPKLAALGEDEMNEVIWTRQGRMLYGIEMKIVDEDGHDLPQDGATSGLLMVRGPWVIERYFKDKKSATLDGGWFDTGDICTIDAFGFMRITDRKKDVIKSGGEWISSIDLENTASGCPGVKIAAVTGVFHPKWEERPIMLIEPHNKADITPQIVKEYLSSRIVKWWMPDQIIIDQVPLTATGKINKKAIRTKYGDILS